MANPRVIVLGKDIYSLGYVSKIIKVQESKTFQRSKIIQNSYTLKVKNFDNFFSVDNTLSLFNGQQWQFSALKIYDEDNELIWDGLLEDVVRDHVSKTATLVSKSRLLKIMSQRVTYESAAYEDPATAAKAILDLYGFTEYDTPSFTASAARLQDNDVYIKCHFKRDDDITIQQALEKLGEVGIADIYEHLGVIYFNTYAPFTGGTKTTLEIDPNNPTAGEKGPTPPKVSALTKELVNEYNISYEGDSDVPATDANSNNIGAMSRAKFDTRELPDLGGDKEEEIEVKDKTAATYIGESYIRRTHANLANNQVGALQKIQFRLPISHRGWVDLRTTFRFTFPDESWTEKLFEVFGFDRDYDNRRMSIMAYEVEE